MATIKEIITTKKAALIDKAKTWKKVLIVAIILVIAGLLTWLIIVQVKKYKQDKLKNAPANNTNKNPPANNSNSSSAPAQYNPPGNTPFTISSSLTDPSTIKMVQYAINNIDPTAKLTVDGVMGPLTQAALTKNGYWPLTTDSLQQIVLDNDKAVNNNSGSAAGASGSAYSTIQNLLAPFMFTGPVYQKNNCNQLYNDWLSAKQKLANYYTLNGNNVQNYDTAVMLKDIAYKNQLYLQQCKGIRYAVQQGTPIGGNGFMGCDGDVSTFFGDKLNRGNAPVPATRYACSGGVRYVSHQGGPWITSGSNCNPGDLPL